MKALYKPHYLKHLILKVIFTLDSLFGSIFIFSLNLLVLQRRRATNVDFEIYEILGRSYQFTMMP